MAHDSSTRHPRESRPARGGAGPRVYGARTLLEAAVFLLAAGLLALAGGWLVFWSHSVRQVLPWVAAPLALVLGLLLWGVALGSLYCAWWSFGAPRRGPDPDEGRGRP